MIRLEERFSACIVVNNTLIPNTWHLSVNLIPNKNIAKNYNTALERIQLYISTILDNSILIGPEHTEAFNKALGFEGKVHLLPDEPYDHLISICLYTKFNSILDKVFLVESVGVTSDQGEGITHTYDCESGDMETLLQLADETTKEYTEYWYKPCIEYFDLDEDGLNITKLDWHELGLEFEAEDKKVVRLNAFKPRIVPKDNDDPDDAG